jgi:hypothetical protein
MMRLPRLGLPSSPTSLTDAVGPDDPPSQRFAVPYRFRRRAPHEDDDEHVTVRRNPPDQLIPGGLEACDFFNVVVLGHGGRLGLVLLGTRRHPGHLVDPPECQ